jgi:hypothetical protein
MRLITIEVMDEVVQVSEGADRRTTLAWRVPDQLEVYLKGKFTDHDYDTARIMALNVCYEMHIPASMLRRKMPVSGPKGRKIDPSQKQLF